MPPVTTRMIQEELEVIAAFLEECRMGQPECPPSLPHAMAILPPGGPAFSVGKPSMTINSNLFHASTGHVFFFLLEGNRKITGSSI